MKTDSSSPNQITDYLLTRADYNLSQQSLNLKQSQVQDEMDFLGGIGRSFKIMYEYQVEDPFAPESPLVVNIGCLTGQATDVDHQWAFWCKRIFNLVFVHYLKGTTDPPQKIHLILNLRLLQVEALLAQVVIGSGQEVVGDLIRRRRVGFHKYSKQIMWVDRS